jgi:hypothetical protein
MLGSLVAGALVVGLAAQATQLMGGDAREILFSGQAAIPDVVAESTGVLLLILVAKAVAYAASLACGFRGGPIFPAILLSIVISTLAVALFDLSTTWAVAVGTAAGMTAGTGLVFSSLLFSQLIVGHAGQDALSACVLAAAAAWLTRSALLRESPSEAAAQPAADH